MTYALPFLNGLLNLLEAFFFACFWVANKYYYFFRSSLASFFETVIVNSHVVPMQLEHLNTARMVRRMP